MARSEQGSVVREIRLLRSRWRGLETESRLGLHGHEWENPGYRQGHDLTDHRASPRPYQDEIVWFHYGIRSAEFWHTTRYTRGGTIQL
jgi:hypothetical protein